MVDCERREAEHKRRGGTPIGAGPMVIVLTRRMREILLKDRGDDLKVWHNAEHEVLCCTRGGEAVALADAMAKGRKGCVKGICLGGREPWKRV